MNSWQNARRNYINMDSNKPTASKEELIDLYIRVLNGNPDTTKIAYARSSAAVLLAEYDTSKSSLALAEAWADEEDEAVREVIVVSLGGHQNDVAKRLQETMQDEIDRRRGRLKIEFAEPDS